jgi:DnaB helicase-like protein
MSTTGKKLDLDDEFLATGALDVGNLEPMTMPASELDALAPTIGRDCPLIHIEAGMERELVSLATLPLRWNMGPKEGHGVGYELNRAIGGGICRGFIMAVGASAAGTGKTAFVMQIADGLAFRTAELMQDAHSVGPLTPIVVVSEMHAEALTWRSLARVLSVPYRVFRAGASAWKAEQVEDLETIRKDVQNALNGDLGDARRWVRVVKRGRMGGGQLVAAIRKVAKLWKQELEQAHGREVLPVVVLDPIQRFLEPGQPEIEGQSRLAELLEEAALEDGLIVMVTSDTSKAAATTAPRKGERPDEVAAVFRGSYKLLHAVDCALVLRRAKQAKWSAGRIEMEVVLAKNRWGSLDNVPFWYDPAHSRFEARGEKEESTMSWQD